MKKTVIFLLFLIACVPAAQQLDIPYFKQKGPSCIQSQMRMALEYFYPEREYSQEELDERTGRQPREWTWFHQALPVLVEEGLDVEYYSMSPYFELNPQYSLEFYGPEVGKVVNQVTNWEEFNKNLDYLRDNPRYHPEQLPWPKVEEFFRKGYVMLMIIDYNVVRGAPGSYAGHGVTITYINQTHVKYHNSNLGPNQVAEKEDFIASWNAKGTDNDVIVVKGKLS